MAGWTFGDFVLDLDTRELRRADTPVPLSPKAFHLLAVLIDSRPKALSKSDLQDRLWPGTFVVEKNLTNLVGEIREALGDDPGQARFIRTVHRFGYAFCAPASAEAREGHLSPPSDVASTAIAEARRHNLPVQLTTFVGRDQEIAEISCLTSLTNHSSTSRPMVVALDDTDFWKRWVSMRGSACSNRAKPNTCGTAIWRFSWSWLGARSRNSPARIRSPG